MGTIGRQIRQKRFAYGMSQAELARRIHLSQTALNQIEREVTRDPRFSIVQKIAGVLGISLDQLTAEDEGAAQQPPTAMPGNLGKRAGILGQPV